MNKDLERQLARWYVLNPHPVQQALSLSIAHGVRFPVVPAGRRSGKSEIFKRFLVDYAFKHVGRYFIGAPSRQLAKDIYWDDMKDLTLSCCHSRPPSESELKIFLPNGSVICVIGMNNPKSFDGKPWAGGGIDEFPDISEDAWTYNIFPALNTFDPRNPDYRPWCWLLGVPDGLGLYFDLSERAKLNSDPLWMLYHWLSSEILPADMIAEARRTLSPMQFRQEFEGSFESLSGRVYPDFDVNANLTTGSIKPHEMLLLTHDQNFTPRSSAVCVVRDGDLYILDEIILKSSVARDSAREFGERYRDHENKIVHLHGDPAGIVGEKHGHLSDYKKTRKVLESEYGWKVENRFKRKAPAIKDRQDSLRSKILNDMGERHCFVNKKRCPTVYKGFSTSELAKNSTFLEVECESQHVMTAIGYMSDVIWPVDRTSIIKSTRLPVG